MEIFFESKKGAENDYQEAKHHALREKRHKRGE